MKYTYKANPQYRICLITKEEAAPFVERFFSVHNKGFDGDPGDGQPVNWFGCLHRGRIEAVVGTLPLPNGMTLITRLLSLEPCHKRAVMVLFSWASTISPAITSISVKNRHLVDALKKRGWQVLREPIGSTLLGRF